MRRLPSSPPTLERTLSASSQKQCPDLRDFVKDVRVRNVRKACFVRCVNACARRRAPAVHECVVRGAARAVTPGSP